MSKDWLIDRLSLAVGGAIGGVWVGPVILPFSPSFDEILTLLPVYALIGGILAVHFLGKPRQRNIKKR